jgi:hypothetical protein
MDWKRGRGLSGWAADRNDTLFPEFIEVTPVGGVITPRASASDPIPGWGLSVPGL